MATSHQMNDPARLGIGDSSIVPTVVVTNASQLPVEFLNPLPERQLVIGLDCEGVDLCRHGAICILQLAFKDTVYLVDAVEGGAELVRACQPALESNFVKKVIHDCKRDSEALYFQFGIKLNNVVDTQIAYSLIKEGENADSISFVALLADPLFGGISYDGKEEVRSLLRQDPNFWRHRPLTEQMIQAATDDVRFLLVIYDKIMENLNEKSLYYLALRGSLYCRCFCLDESNFADWPPLPPAPANLISKDAPLEEEILSVLDVPERKMGSIIGRRGVTLSYIRQCCRVDVFVGADRGPPNKVFIIGPVSLVRKAEAILRGRMY